ncbi:potassium transporter TrkH [Pseudenhygromyxa sp. WMMC2535]|uniref:TrkH family potassium uptake protein n=1 Tax=Pseudenhygromyxa sp. WMMC2535 TaxID=2712867 RepID=UPI0015517A21|nr:potassium transporter TrkG [Pseudenhygromyxa sp. WMMC2535]NVB41139.1 potassium transporter TrkH [Pseudenhygromyxa sp. WMMC2535]
MTPLSRGRPMPGARLREERTLGRAGLLAAFSPLLVPALLRLAHDTPAWLPELPELALLAATMTIAALACLGALTLARWPGLGRALVIIAGLSFAGVAAFALLDHPAKAMAVMLATLLSTTWFYLAPEAGEAGHTHPNSRIDRARMGAWGNLFVVLATVGFQLHGGAVLIAALASVAISLGLAARAIAKLPPGELRALGWRDAVAGGLTVVCVAAAALAHRHTGLACLALMPTAGGLLFALRPRVHRDPLRGPGWRELLIEQPARLIVGTFLLAGIVGGVLLTLPPCSSAAPLPLLDTIFTAFSAVCVTGLAVLDTGADFSLLGQGVILTLIQLGGLGIMTFSAAAMVLLGQRLSLEEEGVALELIDGHRVGGLELALRRMLRVTFISEGVGALLLSLRFALAHADPWPLAIWRGVFTAISAYCNAGFALQSDSLIPYQQDAIVLHVVAALIILGGLGPAVIVALPQLLRRRQRRRMDLHARVVLVTSAALLLAPAVLIAALEWHQSLAALPILDRVHNAWFQSVTTRTAGFNSVDFAAMSPATLTLVEALMFIGGSPGSTAGGIKTSTVFVLVIAVVAVSRSRTTVSWGGWTIPQATVYRAAAVVTLAALSGVLALFAIQLTQPMNLQTALFEVFSALGTVGLSIGGTAMLDNVGKLIIIACMFMGRIAPLTLFLIFSRPRDSALWELPEQEINVG